MIAVRDKLIDAGVTHYYKRRTLGSGFIRFGSGKIYYLPRYIAPLFPAGVVTLSYIVQKDGEVMTSVSKVFTDEPSFRSSLRFLYGIVTNSRNPVLEFRANRKNSSFPIKSSKEILTGFGSGKEMLAWIGECVDPSLLFTEKQISSFLEEK